MKKILLLIISLTLLCGCGNKNIEEKIDEKQVEKIEIIEVDILKERLDSMTLREKVGQLIISGLDGDSISERDIELIEEYNIGGFIFFKNNISNIEGTKKFIEDLNSHNKSNVDLFISVDEEGGVVQRMPDEFTRVASASKVGKKNDKEIAYTYGRILGMRLNYLGFNLDFAPVMDINSNENNPVIGTRAFSNDRDIVSAMGIKAIEGLKAENIKSTIKHFPGHGDTDVDSHYSLPSLDKTLDELRELELYPFKKAIEENVEGIMVGHILFKRIDEFPASLSKVFIDNILRQELNYDGLILSDDMTMGGIVENYSIEEASLKFIDAGGDILLICHGYENTVSVYNTIVAAVEDGGISEDRIDQSVYRILKAKEDLNIESKRSLEEINNLTRDFINTL